MMKTIARAALLCAPFSSLHLRLLGRTRLRGSFSRSDRTQFRILNGELGFDDSIQDFQRFVIAVYPSEPSRALALVASASLV